MRRHKPRVSRFLAGVIGIIVVGIAVYFVFGGGLPFQPKQFTLKAVFRSETELHIPSPVRIAGVDVGELTSITQVAPGSEASVATMSINGNGLPIHVDATAKIRPRIFLEGNFYVDLKPGTPNAPIARSGFVMNAAHTAGPVQLDRVLSALNSTARQNLQTLLRGFGGSLDGKPTPAEDATQDPIVRGLTAGQALNESLKYSPKAFQASAMVNQALLGTTPNDLSGVVQGNQEVFQSLAASQRDLASLVTTFNSTMAALSARQNDLEHTIALLPPLLRVTQTSDTALDRSFPPTKAFARALLPSISKLDPTIGLALPWLAQSTQLMSPRELGGLVRYLTPAIQNTGATITTTKALVKQADLLGRCFEHNIVPAGNERIKDPPSTTGLQVYQELFQSGVGIASATQNFDGNGRYLRASAGGGSILTQTKGRSADGPLFGNAVLRPLGTRPAFPGSPPPVRSNVACFRNAVPNVNKVATGGTP